MDAVNEFSSASPNEQMDGFSQFFSIDTAAPFPYKLWSNFAVRTGGNS